MHRIRTYLLQVVFFVVLALWIPMRLGIAFLDPVVLGAYACLGVVFAAPAAVGVSILRAVASSLAFTWVMLIVGIAVVYFDRHVVVGPDLRSLGECGVFGAALTTAAASVVGFTSQKAGPGVARSMARAIQLGLLALFYLKSRWLPDVALMGAAICAAIAVVFLALMRRTRHA